MAAKRVGPIGWVFALLFGAVVFAVVQRSSDTAPAQSHEPPPSPDQLRQEAKAGTRALVSTMSRTEAIGFFKKALLPICQAMGPRLNYIEAKQRGSGLYCVHDFYNKYSLSAGPLAPAISEFVAEWAPELRRAGIKKVGAWGTGEFASGAWFDVPQ